MLGRQFCVREQAEWFRMLRLIRQLNYRGKEGFWKQELKIIYIKWW